MIIVALSARDCNLVISEEILIFFYSHYNILKRNPLATNFLYTQENQRHAANIANIFPRSRKFKALDNRRYY